MSCDHCAQGSHSGKVDRGYAITLRGQHSTTLAHCDACGRVWVVRRDGEEIEEPSAPPKEGEP